MVTASNYLDLYVSQRFLKAYRKASIGLQRNIEGAVRDFARQAKLNPQTVMHLYDRVAGCKTPILEIPISGQHRSLACYSANTIVMLDVGGHEIVDRYKNKNFEKDVTDVEKAPNQFLPGEPSNFFKNYPDMSTFIKYPEELSSDWVYFLDHAQGETCDHIANNILSTESACDPVFIVGGPGTGKTCILLNLLKCFVELDYRVGIKLSDNLARYVEASTQASIRNYQVKSLNDNLELDLLLIDDPTHNEIKTALNLAKANNVRLVVMAFDPLQLDVAISDNEFNRVANSNDVKTYKLDECYRQKENVGKTTKHIIDVVALSTPYRNERKIRRFEQEHERVTALANNITFTNPHGYTKGYDNFHIQWLEFEVKRIQKTQMWQHWPSLLILTDGFKLPKDIRNVLRPISPKYRKELFLEEVEEVKGLEFQNVFVFISREIYNQLQEGFKGTGRTIYNKMRLMRIPFSRAKDSVVTFAIDIIKSDDGEDKFIVL